MSNLCLVILFIVGSYNAVVGREWERARRETQEGTVFDATCASGSDGFCLWKLEPGASNSWRLNPSYDYDAAKAGNKAAYPFMYFEKFHSGEVGSARLISSDYYTTDYEWNSCFSFSYETTRGSYSRFAGIRVYYKPETLALKDLIAYSEELKKNYTIYEDLEGWGYGWRNQETKLKHFGQQDIFQIVIEAIYERDPLYVAVKDVAIVPCTKSLLPTAYTPRGVNDALSCESDIYDLCGWNDQGSAGEWIDDNPSVRKIAARPETEGKKILKVRFPDRLLQQNRTAHLMSPLYSSDLERRGCFYLMYLIHMIQPSAVREVGIRVYQKPKSVALIDLLGSYSEDKKKDYILFETSANKDFMVSWQEAEPALKHFDEDFQIVIEGIFGSGPKQLKISEMAIRQGSQCTRVGTQRGNVNNTPSTTKTARNSTTTSSRQTTTQQQGTVLNATCEFDSDGICLWENEPGANNSWRLHPSYGYVGEAAFPFMYFEKPSSREIGSVRLISHDFFKCDYDKNGYFSFSYKIHRNSNSSGIRVYQKPETVALRDLLAYSDEAKKEYVLFEVWGDRNNSWYDQEAKLKNFGRNNIFQIIIEGIFDQDPLYIAIRNVSIQRCPANVVAPIPTTTTTTTTTSRPTTTTTSRPTPPPPVPDSLRCGFVDNTLCGWTRYPETKPIPDEKFLPIDSYIDIPLNNRTAYLISSLYYRYLSYNGCFYFKYELLRSTHVTDPTKFLGIKVYQKPEYLTLDRFHGYYKGQCNLFEDKIVNSSYYSGEIQLWLRSGNSRFNDNFQIIVEGIFTGGSKHITISDMEIRQGSQCTAAKSKTSTTTFQRPTTRNQIRISNNSSQPTTTTRPLKANDSLTCGSVGNNLCGWSNYPKSIGTWIKGCRSGGKPNNIDCLNLEVYMPEEEMLIGKRTAHLISPLYSRELDRDGCFYLLYQLCSHSYIGGPGRTVGIRAYQKPDYLALEDLLALSDEVKKDYILFENWSSNINPALYEKESTLKHFDAHFQIVIEGIFEAGPKYISVSSMDIRQGSNCTARITSTSTTTTTSPRPTTTRPIRGVNDSLSCDFDGTELCGWTSYPEAVGSWVEGDSTNDTKMLKVNIREEYIDRNRTAVLISPMYRRELDKDGCFYFMYDLKILDNSNVDYNGRAVGIRVYQKPQYLPLEDLLAYSDQQKKDYIIHQVWGDMGIWTWREKEVRLKPLDDNFQIIIEGCFGPGPRHIAIYDMMILQGSQCTSPK